MELRNKAEEFNSCKTKKTRIAEILHGFRPNPKLKVCSEEEKIKEQRRINRFHREFSYIRRQEYPVRKTERRE